MPDNRQRNNGKKGASPIDPNFAHVQPQAVEIERVVLGALMVDSDAFLWYLSCSNPKLSMSLAIRRYTRLSVI